MHFSFSLSSVELVGCGGALANGTGGQRPGVVGGLVPAVHVALHALEGVEGHLWRETRRPVRIDGGRALLARVGALEEDVVGVDLPDAEVLEAASEVPILLPVLRRLPDLALAVALGVGPERRLRDHFDGAVHADVAVVDEEALLGGLAAQQALPAQEQRLQADRDEDGVGVELDDPVRSLRLLIGDDLVPEPHEDPRVEHRVELPAGLPRHAAVDKLGAHHGQLPPLGEEHGLVAVDGEVVARKHPDLPVRVLRAEEPHLIAEGQHHGGAEEHRGRRRHRLHHLLQLRRGVFWQSLVDAAVEVLAAALERQAVIWRLARPLVDVVAALEAEDEEARAGAARLLALRLLPVERVLVLLKFLEAGLGAQAVVPALVLVDADIHVPHHVPVALGAWLGVLADRRRRWAALLEARHRGHRMLLAHVVRLAASRPGVPLAAALAPQLRAGQAGQAQGAPRGVGHRHEVRAPHARQRKSDGRAHADGNGELPQRPPSVCEAQM
mmetsp:Transcript_60730/g.170150  ORF Transcript_60730/g.170150 Transcript_60730/m.170150 type:complete len:498 (-) Transcript_60730:140-1633(-)